MSADDEEIEACVALGQLRGRGKRQWGSVEEDDGSEPSTPVSKIPRTSKTSSIRSNRPRPRPSSTPYNATRGHVTKANIEAVRDQLSNLTLKNEEIKLSMHEWRKTLVDELFSHMRVRNIAIATLGRRGADEETREICFGALQNRKQLIMEKEEELLKLEKLLSSHVAVFEFADSAYTEIVQKIKMLDTWAKEGRDPGLSLLDFPQMSKLARLTGGATEDIHENTAVEEVDNEPMPSESFPRFSEFPPEIRLMIWQYALPCPRIITHRSAHNATISLLSTNRESRLVAFQTLTCLLSPTPNFPNTSTPILYIQPRHDTIIRDLTLLKAIPDRNNVLTTSIFALSDVDFNRQCFHNLSGLSQVQHLALSFDLLHENGGVLFGPIQACCPSLSTLTLFPSSQYSHNHAGHCYETNKFITIDSNLVDYIDFRYSLLEKKSKVKEKAARGMETILTLANHTSQYMEVFPNYVSTYGREWKPSIKVCLLVHFNELLEGWQTGWLLGDKYSKGFQGDDGRKYKGWVESLHLADKDGELLSRYDGMERLFGERSRSTMSYAPR